MVRKTYNYGYLDRPLQLPAVRKFLSKKFSKGKNNPSFISFLSANKGEDREIEEEHWVTYTISNFQEKTIQRLIAEITGRKIEKITVEYGSGPGGHGDIIRVGIY